MRTTIRTAPWRARTLGAIATLLLTGVALTGCSGTTTEGPPADAGTAGEAPSDAGGGTAATGSPSAESTDGGSSGTPSGSGESSERTGAAETPEDEAESFLFRASDPGDGDIATSGGYGIIGEPLGAGTTGTTVTASDNQQLMDSASSGYTADCEGTMTLGGDPVPCTFDKDGEVLEGEAVCAKVAGGDNAIVIGHIEGSSDGDQPLSATGDEGILAAYYADGEGGPDDVTATGREDTLVYGYSLGGDAGDPSRIEGVSAECELQGEALEVACIPQGADGLDGTYRAAYHPGADGAPVLRVRADRGELSGLRLRWERSRPRSHRVRRGRTPCAGGVACPASRALRRVRASRR